MAINLDFILDFLFPKKCLGCGNIGKYFCEDCLTKIKRAENQVCPGCYEVSFNGKTHEKCRKKTELTGLYFGFLYEGMIKRAVRKIKYQQVFSIKMELMDLFMRNFPREKFQEFVFIPIALHKRRLRERGFNQAEIIAKEICKRANYTFCGNVLKRVKNTKTQTELTRRERQKNIAGAFQIENAEEIRGKKIAVIDDVFTSGATLNECAKELKKSGAKEVWGVVVAHGK